MVTFVVSIVENLFPPITNNIILKNLLHITELLIYFY
jgi:hypothetical protein